MDECRYRYTITFKAGYQCTTGFGARGKEFNEICDRVARSHDVGYSKSYHQQYYCGTIDTSIFITGWDATVTYTRRNGPGRQDILRLERFVGAILAEFGGEKTGRRLECAKLEYTEIYSGMNIPGVIALPYEK